MSRFVPDTSCWNATKTRPVLSAAIVGRVCGRASVHIATFVPHGRGAGARAGRGGGRRRGRGAGGGQRGGRAERQSVLIRDVRPGQDGRGGEEPRRAVR